MTFYFLYLVSLAWLTNQACPTNTFKVFKSAFNCSISFQANGSSCNKTVFTSCSVTTCAGSGQSCSAIAYTVTNPAVCLSYCCEGYDQAQDSFSAAQTCANNSAELAQSTTRALLIGIIVTITGGIALFILFVLWMVRRSKKSKVNSHNGPISEQITNPQALNLQIRQQVKINRNESSTQMLKVRSNIKFQWKDYQSLEAKESDCMICLNNDSNLKLQCGHFFHPKCLREWLKKKGECGVCRSRNLMSMVLICKKCNKRHCNIAFFQFRMMRQQNEICQDCSNS